MAETAIGLLIDKLIPFLDEEAKLLTGVHKEVGAITRELRSIQVFLKDADQRAGAEGDNDGVQLWVDELREAATKIEDVIDEYTCHIEERVDQQKQDRSKLKHRFICFLRKVSCFVVKLKPRHDIASRILELKQEVQDINKRGTMYGFTSAQLGSSSSKVSLKKTWSDPREDSRFLKADDAVGIQDDCKDLVVRMETKSLQQEVIAVIGMGGIGKTTLASQVYEQAKENFECHAWIDVSKTFNDLEILRSLIQKFSQSRKEPVPEGLDQEKNGYDLRKRLRDYLEGKSYLITFDDVWDVNFWGRVKNALPNNGDGSRGRIVITTRIKEVADFCKTSTSVHVHDMKLLSFDDSMKLFCNKAFHSEPEKKCPDQLISYSREIIERCGHLPLAIAVIGGVLATKDKTLDEWRKLLASLSSELESNTHLSSISKILSLSYNDLPYNLKSCFLYLGIFPEDHSIRSRGLVRQWIAEGFVKPQKGKTIEVVAEEYLTELMNRSMVQVSKTIYEEKPRTCRVHDLVRDFIIKKMEALKFCTILSESNPDLGGLAARRISIFQSCSDAIKKSNIRSVFVFDIDERPDPLVKAITKSFNLLRVLDFEGAWQLDHIPDDIGSLFHLRYLSLRDSRVEFLPKSIGKLENLETLDLKRTLVHELPVEIKNLRKLRHLLVYRKHHLGPNFFNKLGVKVKKGFGSIKSLQKLHQIDVNVEGVDILEELSHLTELRALGMSNFIGENGRALCRCIQKLKCLESFDDDQPPLDLEPISSPPILLRRLYLVGRLKKFPGWVGKLDNLIRIRLFSSKLEDSPLEVLQNLQNLLEIRIFKDAYCGEVLRFRAGMFPKLMSFLLLDLSRLSSMVIEEGALPNLEDLVIGRCPELKQTPCCFQHLKKLKFLRFREMTTAFLLSQNFQSLQSVPNVQFQHKIFYRTKSFPLSWVMKAQERVPEEKKEEWFSLEFEELYRIVEPLNLRIIQSTWQRSLALMFQ